MPVLQPMRGKNKTNRTFYTHFSRALNKFRVIAGNSDWFFSQFSPVVRAGVIALVLVVRQSFENHSMTRFITSKFITMSVMTIRNTMNRNEVTPGRVPPELKVSSKSNSPIIITAVFTKERPGLENPSCKTNE